MTGLAKYTDKESAVETLTNERKHLESQLHILQEENISMLVFSLDYMASFYNVFDLLVGLHLQMDL